MDIASVILFSSTLPESIYLSSYLRPSIQAECYFFMKINYNTVTKHILTYSIRQSNVSGKILSKGERYP